MAKASYVATAAERDLRQLISERYPANSRLPAERELAQVLNTSRNTLREVVSSMVRAGELVRKWGIGTFVAAPTRPFIMSLNRDGTRSFRQRAEAQGFEARFTHFNTAIESVDAEIGHVLGVQNGANVWRVARILELDGQPALWVTDWVPTVLNGHQMHLDKLGSDDKGDFIPFIERTSGLRMTRLESRIMSGNASAEEAQTLTIDTGSPMIVAITAGTDSAGTPITRTRTCYVPGRVEIHVSSD